MQSNPVKRPNIVLFMVDQLSARWLEAAFGGVCPTPNIDKLRGNGVVFTNTITSNPVCCPTRATIATGLTTRGHGVLENGYQLDSSIPTFMQLLQKNGWRTGAFGKVHFHPHFAGLYPDYRPYGFDVTYITEDPRGGEWLDWVEKEHPEHYEAALATIWPTAIPDFAEYGDKKVNLRQRIAEIRKEFKWATPEFPKSTGGAYALPFPEEVSQTNWITGHALDFLNEVSSDQPLFAHISYVQPHGPFCPPGKYMKYVNTDKIPKPAAPEWVLDPHAPGYFKDKTPVAGDWQYMRQCYFADIVHLDHQLGEIMKALEKTGRMDNTHIIFISDHGELLNDHGFRGKEERHYDACIRVPLIVAGTGIHGGLVRDEMVQLEDICPTILDIAGLTMPAIQKMGPYLKIEPESISTLPGKSLLELCHGGKPETWRESAYSESYNAIWSITPGDWARTIRTRDFRYTFYASGNGEQMFNIETDPGEQHNLVADPAYAKKRQELRDKLMELIVMQDYPKTRRELFALGVH